MLSGLKSSDECKCIDNATADSNDKCVCNDGYTETNGVCIKNQPTPTPLPNVITLNMNSDTLFDSGSATVKNAKDLTNDLQQQINERTELVWDNLTYCVSVTGHTDRTNFRRGSKMNNQTLSEQRAKAVEQIMRQVFTMGTPNFQSSGKGASECTAPTYKRNDKRCRHVKIVIADGKCNDTNTDMKTSAITAAAAAVADATSQTPEKVDTRTNEPTEQKVEKQETTTDTPATGADSANTGETTTTPSSDEKVSTPSDTSGNDENAKKFQDLMKRLDAQTYSAELTKGFNDFPKPEQGSRPKRLTDDEIKLISDALDICAHTKNGYLTLEVLTPATIPQKYLYVAKCYSDLCMGTCSENSSKFKTYKNTIKNSFAERGYANNVGVSSIAPSNIDSTKDWWPVWDIVYRVK